VDAAPVAEVQKSPEAEAADKTIRKFMKHFMTNLLTLQSDLNEYRYYTTQVEKVALWPKKLTESEIQAIKDKDEADKKAAEEAEAKAAEEAAAAAALQAPGKPGKNAQAK